MRYRRLIAQVRDLHMGCRCRLCGAKTSSDQELSLDVEVVDPATGQRTVLPPEQVRLVHSACLATYIDGG